MHEFLKGTVTADEFATDLSRPAPFQFDAEDITFAAASTRLVGLAQRAM